MEERDLVYNLWWCLSLELKRAATNDGMDDKEYNSEAKVLTRLKQIAVKSQNTLVSQVQFLSISQDRNENIHSFVTRLSGAAIGCKFKVECNVERWPTIQIR